MISPFSLPHQPAISAFLFLSRTQRSPGQEKYLQSAKLNNSGGGGEAGWARVCACVCAHVCTRMPFIVCILCLVPGHETLLSLGQTRCDMEVPGSKTPDTVSQKQVCVCVCVDRGHNVGGKNLTLCPLCEFLPT